MERRIFLLLIFVCRSYQRPQLELDDPTTTAETTDTTTEEIVTSTERTVQVTEATAPAVTVQTSINVTKSNIPHEIFEDFKPSKYYRPDGYPVFERPSPQVTHEVFYKPQYFSRPNNNYLIPPMPSKPNEKNVVFPQATREYYNYSEHLQHNSTNNHHVNSHNKNVQNHNKNVQNHNKNNTNNNDSKWLNGPESRGPYRFTEVLPQFKPIKHDHGEIIPNFSTYDNDFYEKNFAKFYYGNEMSNYPDIIHEPPKSYNSVATRKKKDPWRSVLSVLATILPVGLLLASFPPTVIKVNSTQYPYQFQKNSTVYYPNMLSYPGSYTPLRRKSTGRKINGEDNLLGYLDGCLKRKICENMKVNYSPSELDSLLQNNKSNSTDDTNYRSPMVEIAEAAASTLPESCQTFVCSN